MKKNFRNRGKISLTDFFAVFKNEENVVLKAEPYYHNGMFHLRYHGNRGKIVGKRGECYLVQIKDGGKTKILIVHPIHLLKVH